MEDYWYYVIAFVIVIAFIYFVGVINKKQTGSVNGVPRSINFIGNNGNSDGNGNGNGDGYQSYQDIINQLNNAAAYSDGSLIDDKYYKSVSNISN